MQASAAGSAQTQWELQRCIYEEEQQQLQGSLIGAAGQAPAKSSGGLGGGSSAGIRKVLSEHGIASIDDPDVLLLLRINSSTSHEKSVDPRRIGRAFRCVEVYVLNLYHRPWKKEYYRLKRYGGFYKTFVDPYLKGVEVIFHRIGYTLSDDGSEWHMVGGPGSPAEWAAEMAPLCLSIAFNCRVAAIECDCAATACAQQPGDWACMPSRVLLTRLELPASPADTAAAATKLRPLADRGAPVATAAATATVGAGWASRVAAARPSAATGPASTLYSSSSSAGGWQSEREAREGSDVLVTGGITRALVDAMRTPTGAAGWASAAARPPAATGPATAPYSSASVGGWKPQGPAREQSDVLVTGAGSRGDPSAAVGWTGRHPAASGVLPPPPSRHREPEEMAEPRLLPLPFSSAAAWAGTEARGSGSRSFDSPSDRARPASATGTGAAEAVYDDVVQLARYAVEPRPARDAAAAVRLPSSSLSEQQRRQPEAAGKDGVAVGHVPGFGDDDAFVTAAPHSVSQQHFSATGRGPSLARAAAAASDATPAASAPSLSSQRSAYWPEEATTEEHMAMSLQLLGDDDPALPCFPPLPAFSSGSDAFGRASGFRPPMMGYGSALRDSAYQDSTEWSPRLASVASARARCRSPGGADHGHGDTDWSMTRFSIREPPPMGGGSCSGSAAAGAERQQFKPGFDVAARDPVTSGIGGAARGSGLSPSKPSASFPQYVGSFKQTAMASFPQCGAASSPEEATRQRKQFAIYGRIDM